MPSPVIQFQILSHTPDETAQFYVKLFGWTVRPDNPLGGMLVRTGSDAGIQGGIWPAPPEAANFVQLFVAVEDVKAAVKKAEELGARLMVPPTIVAGGDEMAVVLDPQGMSFAVCKSAQAI